MTLRDAAWRAVAALALIAGTTAALPVARAGAQQPIELRLVRQTLVVAPGHLFEIALTAVGRSLPADAELAVTLSNRLEDPRADLGEMLAAGTPSTATSSFFTIPLAEVPRGDAGQLLLSVPVVGRGEDRPTRGFRLSNPGLFPLQIEVRSGDDDDLASLLTVVARPRTDEGQERRLPVAFVMQHTAPPAVQPDLTVRFAPSDEQQLATIASLLARQPSLPAAVGLPPELVSALGASGLAGPDSVIASLTSAIAGRTILASTFVTMDPSAAARSALGPTFTEQLTEGEEALATTFAEARTSRSEWFRDGGLGVEGVELLRSLGVRNVVLPYDAVTNPAGDVDVTRGMRLAAGAAATVQVGVVDPLVRTTLAAPGDDPVLAAHLAVAGILAADFEWELDDPEQHGIVVAPAGGPLDPLLIGTVVDLLATTAPLRPVTLEEWFRTVAVQDDGTITLAPVLPEDQTTLAGRLAETSIRIDDVSSMAVERPSLADDLHSLANRSLATELGTGERDAYFTSVEGQLGAITGAVLPIEVERFTMTGRSARLPLTIRTSTEESLQVRLRLRSPKLTFPAGDQLVTVTGGSARVEVPVEARSNGTFIVNVDLLTPTQAQPIMPPAELRVTAASFSGLSIAITIVAGLLLAVWWVQHARRSRRRRREDIDEAARQHPTAALAADPTEPSRRPD
jgi:hypothetical protein